MTSEQCQKKSAILKTITRRKHSLLALFVALSDQQDSYEHFVGTASIGSRTDDFSGMIGILFDGKDLLKQNERDNINIGRVRTALGWLKCNNPIYKEFLLHIETLYYHFKPQGIGLPTIQIDNIDVHNTALWRSYFDNVLTTNSVSMKSVPVGDLSAFEGFFIVCLVTLFLLGFHLDVTLFDHWILEL